MVTGGSDGPTGAPETESLSMHCRDERGGDRLGLQEVSGEAVLQGDVDDRRHTQGSEDVEAEAPEGTSTYTVYVTVQLDYYFEFYVADPVTHVVTKTVQEYEFHGREYPLELIYEHTETLP